jgi:hypothetical protein
MSYRTVTVEVKVKLLMKVDEGVEVSEVIQEMDCNFQDQSGFATIEDTEILDHEVKDSR